MVFEKMKITPQNTILFLTACVNPNGMSFTTLQNPDVRINQYLETINFFLQSTNYRILVVENTNYDFTNYFLDEINNDRIECLCFKGNNFDKSLGKGYGEGLIIRYAFENSNLIKECSNIIKITGRHKIVNINTQIHYINIFSNNNKNFIVIDPIKNKKKVRSEMIVASKSFFVKYLNNEVEKINDTRGFYFEHILFQCAKKALKDSFSILHFPICVVQQGQSGSTGSILESVRLRRHISCFVTMLLYKMGFVSLK